MHKNEKCMILDEVDEIMSLTSIEDFKLIFMNNHLKQLLGISPEDDSYIGKKCYELIHNRTTPCEFCVKFNLSREKFESKVNFIPRFNQYHNIKCKKIMLNDEEVRLLVTEDITESENIKLDLSRKNKTEQSILNYINKLTNYSNIENSTNGVLEEITNYYKADRGYIFEINYDNNTVSNTHEYIQEGITPQIDELQELPMSVLDRWIELFKTQNFVYIDSLNEESELTSEEYKILKDQEIDKLLACPFYHNNRLKGFIGIDNPRYDFNDPTLLKSMAFIVLFDIIRRKQIKQLEKISAYDSLTGLRNRNSYTGKLDYFENNKPSSIGIIFMDLNGLKEANDQYGHQYGDKILIRSAELISKHFPDDAYRVGGDEFVVLLSDISKEFFDKKVLELRQTISNDDLVKISVGSIFEVNPEGIEALVIKADELMYKEKMNK